VPRLPIGTHIRLGLVAALLAMLEHDRRQAGWSVDQAAWRLGVSTREHRELEAGARWPSWQTFDRICKLFGWPQTFVGEAQR
jgi:hypothetical protein